MDEEIRRRLSEHFRVRGHRLSRVLYQVCEKAYMTAGKPFGESDQAMMLWVECGRGTTVN